MNLPRFDGDRDETIARARAAGVRFMLAIGMADPTQEHERGALGLAEKYDFMRAAIAVHPHDAGQADAAVMERVAGFARGGVTVGIGETGLDYFYKHSTVETQHARFREHIRLAQETGKPIIIHSRDAAEDTFKLLDEESGGAIRGVMHCYTYGPREMEWFLKLGMHISFSGVVTYPKAPAVAEAAKAAPLDRILVETDCPFLAPAPLRGKRNEPAFVVHTARKLAELRGLEFDALARATTANFHALFGYGGAES